MGERIITRTQTILWASLALLLPITSLPLLSRISGGTMVAPASIIPMFGLIAINLIPYLIRGGTFPKLTIPLFGFVLVAILSSAMAFFTEIPLFREVNRLRNTFVGLFTLLIGISFFLVAISWVNSTDRLKLIYRWVNIGGIILIAWSLAQSLSWMISRSYPDWMWQVQQLISSSGNLYDRRTTGLAFEPSWLGHQLVLLYLPYWLAATVQNTSAFKKFKFLSVENVLLVAGLSVLWLSFSRSALISFFMALTLVFIRLTAGLVSYFSRKLETKSTISSQKLSLPLWTIIMFFYIFILTAVVYFFTQIDPRMADLFNLLTQQVPLFELAEKMVFGERVVFWLAGINTFGQYPFLGVGLNNSGFFIPGNLPVMGWTLAESHKMYYTTALPNTLSLWIRLLAETGVIGFSLFISWIVLLSKTSINLLRSANPWHRTAALAGQFALAALIMEGMSVDTFAFPYFWLSFGWMVAAYRINSQVNHPS